MFLAPMISQIACVLVLCGTILLLPACRSTPRSPSAPPDASEQSPPESVPPPAVEAPKAPEIPPAKPQISRTLPESVIAAPEKDSAPLRVDYNTVLTIREPKGARNSLWRYRATRQGGRLVGFEFSNTGGNRILPPRRDAVKNQFFTRDFQFRFDDRARQDIHLLISDWPPSRDRSFRLSEVMNRLMLFFPRTYLPAIVNTEARNIVTLPTGEDVEFDPVTHEIIGGVLVEAPVDLNPDRALRQFPAIEYRGRGVLVRADARGSDPRMAEAAVITTGTAPESCADANACRRCEVKPREIWEQSGAARFKFATDERFDRFLRDRCGFGLPKLDIDLAAAGPSASRR